MTLIRLFDEADITLVGALENEILNRLAEGPLIVDLADSVFMDLSMAKMLLQVPRSTREHRMAIVIPEVVSHPARRMLIDLYPEQSAFNVILWTSVSSALANLVRRNKPSDLDALGRSSEAIRTSFAHRSTIASSMDKQRALRMVGRRAREERGRHQT